MPEGHHLDRPKGGRPRKLADPARVLALFKQGLTVPEVARALHMSPKTLITQVKANPTLRDAVDQAHVQVLADLSRSLMAKARTGHAPSLKLALERLEQSRIR